MAIKLVCDFCDKPLEYDGNRYVIYRTKRLDIRSVMPHLCKSCAEKLDMVIEIAEDVTRKRCQDFGHWANINKIRRERLGTKG